MSTTSLQNDLLTVACVWAGNKYSLEYVKRLQNAVSRHLTVPYRFICLTDHTGDIGCETLPIPMNLPGWWGKVALFSNQLIPGRILFLDLDTVIIGNIDDFANYTGDLAVIRPFYRDTGIASGLMNIGPEAHSHVWDNFRIDPLAAVRYCHDYADPKWNCGDQRWLELNVSSYDYWQDLVPNQMASYKVHCINGPPDDARIICFHGKPDPHEVQDKWVLDNWV